MKRALCALFLLVSTGIANACPYPVPVLDKASIEALYRKPNNKGVLLEGHRDGSTVWLYGTIHINKPKNSLPGPAALGAISAADAVFFEMDPFKAENQAAYKQAASQGARLTPSQKERAVALAKQHCLPPEVTDNSASLVVSLLTVETFKAKGLFPDYGTDIVIRGMAGSLKKPVHELETPEEQSSYMDGLVGDESNIDEALSAIEKGSAADTGERIVEKWTNQDRKGLRALGEELKLLGDGVQQRNARMADKIDEYVAGHPGNVFVATGVFHLVGNNNLASLLREKGFVFERR
ncbi:TraB/GumN family protein [Pseudomonas matsuisoli]|uniref:TraB/GumN family protein n=1 Tax=Pseudomonas matsuisoli TaxID=1515666 RepID=A0A917PVA5_9PSED|nr:TraB/GumN family protein [Pseudomonas matsuisoli]GGJ93544.1 hypothetical protein GCM10009304_19390 [Pseudomonas matsuisoli]